ncbi:MAG: TolC family protein [Simkaniaceae bacterium]|nr:TolC family protein [Candidatus Sacchlamyda saccharinae]
MKLRFLSLLFTFSLSGLLAAEECLTHSKLELPTLICEVLQRNPDLSATQERINAAEFFQKRVQILEDPFFSVMRHDQPFGSERNSIFIPKTRFTLTQEFPFPGKLSLKGKIAQQQVVFLESEKLSTIQELILLSKKIFFQLYFNKSALEINEINRQIVSEFVQQTMSLYRTGEDGFSEAVKAQVELQILDDEKLKLNANKDRLLSMLNAILDRPSQAPLGIPEAMFSSSISLCPMELECIAYQHNPEVQGIEAKIGEQNYRRDLAKKDYYPDFTVSSRFDHRIASNDTAWGVAVGINLPIWIPWKQRRDVQQAKALARSHCDELDNLKSMIRGKIREILAEVSSLDERILLLRTGILPKTLESLESGKSEYKAGRGDFLTLLDTIRQYYIYQLEYENARAQREIFLAELERTIGIYLEEIKCASLK